MQLRNMRPISAPAGTCIRMWTCEPLNGPFSRTHIQANLPPRLPIQSLASFRNWLVAAAALSSEIPARRSEEHTSELQSLMRISYAVFCLKKKQKQNIHTIQ